MMKILVKGAGVAGLALAHQLMQQGGAQITVCDVRPQIGGGASWFAGGMLAPFCERQSAPELVFELGCQAADWWAAAVPDSVLRHGTLVLTMARDSGELKRVATKTIGYEWLDSAGVEALEPDLGSRFKRGLYYDGEAHLDPRRTLTVLCEKLLANGVTFQFNTDGDGLPGFDYVCDCSGSKAVQSGLRGVRGEMLILHAPDVTLSRPVRLLHPRIPLYIVPREDHHFMIGATMIESNHDGPVTARSLMELLNAAYSVHPGFGEAAVIETGVGIRPAYVDNLPRVHQNGSNISINGFYRHGFLLAPALAAQASDLIFKKGRR